MGLKTQRNLPLDERLRTQRAQFIKEGRTLLIDSFNLKEKKQSKSRWLDTESRHIQIKSKCSSLK